MCVFWWILVDTSCFLSAGVSTPAHFRFWDDMNPTPVGYRATRTSGNKPGAGKGPLQGAPCYCTRGLWAKSPSHLRPLIVVPRPARSVHTYSRHQIPYQLEPDLAWRLYSKPGTWNGGLARGAATAKGAWARRCCCIFGLAPRAVLLAACASSAYPCPQGQWLHM